MPSAAEAILDQLKKVIDESLIQAEGTVLQWAVTTPHTSLGTIISLVFQFVRAGADNSLRTQTSKCRPSDFWKAMMRGFNLVYINKKANYSRCEPA